MSELPLAGRTVVVTRATDQAGSLTVALEAEGATVVELPVVAIAEPADGGAALDAALAGIAGCDWVVVTSPNGARRVVDRLGGGVPAATRFAAVGPKTAAPLVDAGIPVDLVPDRAVAESLLEAFPAPPPDGGRVLLARAEVARDVLPDGLRAGGPTPADAVCIGPISAAAARELGYRAVEAEPHSVDGLVATACAWATG